MEIKVSSIKRDENIGIIKKKIVIPSEKPIITPTKAIKNFNEPTKETICEISKRVTNDMLNKFNEEQGYSTSFVSRVKQEQNKKNPTFVYLDLKTDELPSGRLLETFSHVLYSASSSVICLPFVKKSVFMDDKKITEKKVKEYIQFQKDVINNIRIKNSKPLIGIIPLLVPKYSRLIIEEYVKEGVNSFMIDAGTANLLNHEPYLRGIYSAISQNIKDQDNKTLEDVYIHSVNLGIDSFKDDKISADDFLPLFTYVDVVGNKFKTRGYSPKVGIEPLPPKRKIFSEKEYSYDLIEKLPEGPRKESLKHLGYQRINILNEKLQYEETIAIKEKIGVEDLYNTIKNKKMISENKFRKIEKIFSSISV